jgi:hypothetical protein
MSDSDSTKPIKSKHQSHPWQPTVDTSDSSQSAAGKDYTDVYGGTVISGKPAQDDGPNEKSGREPILTMAYTTAPDFIPAAENKSGDTKDAPSAMESGEFSIQLATLHSSEQTCLTATSSMVTGYGTLKAVVDKAATDPNFFGQKIGHDQDTQGNSYAAHSWSWVEDQYDTESVDFAAAIIPQMKNLLNSIGNAIEACGQFNALLNNAGQIYATIDRNAEFKDG